MAEGRSRAEWERASLLAALLANGLLRGPGKPPFLPKHFNPHESKGVGGAIPDPRGAWAAMRAVFNGR
jgi:hypothetical protein